MKNRLQKIVRSELVVNSAKLLSANVVAQGIGLIVYPILTRIYSPEDFGLLNLFLSIGGVLVLFATAEYQYAIVLPKEEEKARALVHVCGTLLLTVTGVVVLSVPFSKPIANLFNTPELAKWYWMMPLFVFTMGAWNILNYWYIRRKQFGAISKYQLSQSGLSAAVKMGCGSLRWTAGGLIIGSVFAPILSLIINIFRHWKHIVRDAYAPMQKVCYYEEARKYRKFPMYSFPRALINTFGGNLPALILTPFFGLSELGFFGMAMTLAFRPLNMISASLYQTFFQRIAKQVNNRQLIMPFFRRFLSHALLVIIPTFLLIYFILPWLTEWLLGTGWSQTGKFIRVMLPWLAVLTISASIGFMSDIFQKQHIAAIVEVVCLVLRTASLWAGIYLNDFYTAIALYSIVGTIIQTGLIIWYMHLARQHDEQVR